MSSKISKSMSGNMDVSSRFPDIKYNETHLPAEYKKIMIMANKSEALTWVVDASDFSVISFNPALSEYYRKFKNMTVRIGMKPEVLLCESSAAIWRGMYESALRNGGWSGQYKPASSEMFLSVSLVCLSFDSHVSCILVSAKDISGQIKAEKALAESEARFRGIVDSTDDVVFTLDPEQRHTGVYGRWLNKSSLKEDLFIGKTASQIFGADAGRVHSENNIKALAGENVIYEWKLDSGEQQTFYQTSLSPMYGADGMIFGIVGIGRDITKLKLAEIKLARSEEQYKKAQAMGRIGHWQYEPNEQTFTGSDETMNIFGFSGRKKVHLREITKCVLPAHSKRLKEAIDKLIESKKFFNEEFEITANDTREKKVIWAVAGLQKNDAGNVYINGVLQDVTVQNRMQRELQQSIDHSQRILNNLQDGYFQAETAGRIIMTNPEAARMFGYTYADEMIGVSILDFYSDIKDREKAFLLLGEQGSIRDFCCRAKKKDGSEMWISVNVQFLRNGSGEIIGTEGAVRDITERMNLESELKRQKAILEESSSMFERRLEQSINAISKMVEFRDVYTAGHQKRVRALACAIAAEMGLDEGTVKAISYSAIMHDVGKIYIASDILNKPGRISSLEYQILKTHTQYGYEIAREIDFEWKIPDIILQHHERIDGSGYPAGLRASEILPESRILAVADVVEAMNSHRPYRPALGISAALEEICMHKGTKYDPEAVEACLRLFNEKGFAFD